MNLKLSLILLGSAVWLGACNESPEIIDPPVDPPPSTALPILGHGIVTERTTSEVAAAGDWVYTGTWGCSLMCGNTIKIWNASAATPVLVDSLQIPLATTTGDVQLSQDGQLLVVASERIPGAISIFDRSTPSKPVLLKRFIAPDIEGGVHTVKLGIVNNHHYAFLSIDPSPNSRARLVIVDITDPRNPAQVFSQPMGNPFVHDVYVRDGILFTALWDDGLTIWDIGGGGRGGTPAAPVQLGNVKTIGGDVHNVVWFHDPTTNTKRYAFVGQESGGITVAVGDIHVIDVTDLTDPREVAYYHVDGAGVHNFAMDEPSGVLYAAYYNGGVRALDVRGDLSNCMPAERVGERCNLGLMNRQRGHVAFQQAVSIWGVALTGNLLYASDMLSGIWKIDVSALKR